MLRRIERRINVHNLPDLSTYVTFLQAHPEEIQALLKDLLISVTNFFRDSSVFTTLELQLIPLLTQTKSREDTLRIWVAGCATGEEAYSLAMLCAERTLDVVDAPAVQIFATDLDETALATAREGLYTLNDAADVSPERLRRFFAKEGEAYRIRPEIREMVLFAHHNVLKDPPIPVGAVDEPFHGHPVRASQCRATQRPAEAVPHPPALADHYSAPRPYNPLASAAARRSQPHPGCHLLVKFGSLTSARKSVTGLSHPPDLRRV